MEALRFMHAADLHLGSRLKAGSPAEGDVRAVLEGATYRALERIVTATLDAEAEFLVIAGDLYDHDSRSVRAQAVAAHEFARLAERGVPVFIVHGNHDPLEAEYSALAMPENVTVFGSEAVESHRVVGRDGTHRATVMGVSYRHARESRKLAAQFPAPTEPVPHVAVLHTALDPADAHYAPASLDALCGRVGIAYWALGHQHAFRLVRRSDPCVVFPGIPQGRDVGETGPCGAVLAEIDAGRDPRLTFVPVADVLWSHASVDLGAEDGDAAANLDDVHERIVGRADALLGGQDDWQPVTDAGFELDAAERSPVNRVVRWRLHGAAPAHAALYHSEEEVEQLAERLRRAYGRGSPFLWTESIDLATRPPVPDLGRLRTDDPVIRLLFDTSDGLLRHDAAERAAWRERAGTVWAEPRGREEDDPTRLELADEELDELLVAARDLALARLLEARE